MNGLAGLFLAQEAQPSMWGTVIFIACIFAILYFLMIRPQKKKEQERRKMIDEIKKGDRVVTIGGIHGEVVSLKDKTMVLLVDPERGGTLKLNRSAVLRVVQGDADAEGGE